jgi:putative flavoprotein involved in K+ transport
MPPGTRDFPPAVTQLLAEEYRNPALLPPGAVLIVGSGQTGCQLAEELHEAGRRVILACGRCLWAPRRMGGRDLVWWIVESGFWNRTLADLPLPAARLLGNPQASGHGGGHDLHYRTLHEMGVELVDRFLGASDGKAYFGGDLSGTVQAGDGLSAVFKKWVDALCEKRGLSIPWDLPAPLRIDGRTEIDIAREGIGTVIWTAGFRPDYGWVHLPVFDEMGFPVQVGGRSAVKALYFMGVHFQRKAQSATLYGAGEDAEIVAQHIIENRS